MRYKCGILWSFGGHKFGDETYCLSFSFCEVKAKSRNCFLLLVFTILFRVQVEKSQALVNFLASDQLHDGMAQKPDNCHSIK